MDSVIDYQYNGYEISINVEEDPLNPREEYDHLGTMVCFHGRYDLGDKGHGYKHSNYNSWFELKEAIIKEQNPLVILPMYLLDHNGLRVSTSSFHDPWDSGQIGYIYVSRQKVCTDYKIKRINSNMMKVIEDSLRSEVTEYDQYLSGEVYAFSVTKENKLVDSCSGYYGYDYVKQEAEAVCV